MSANDTGGPAFPLAITQDPNGGVFDPRGYGADGMTLRDYFAAKAMQGFASDGDLSWKDGVDGMARCAYEWADAMIRARLQP
jgi:hypothetical protein